MIKRLHPLFDEDGAIGAESGVDTTPAAEVNTQVDDSQTGVESQGAADPEKQNNYEKAFAKRLDAAKASWEKENGEKYKDYETLKKTTTYFQQRHGYTDLMAMNEDIELAVLQERAEKENVPPEVLKRIDQLEAEAAEGKELKQKNQEDQRVSAYFSTLGEFVKDKGVSPEDLNKFMIENELQYNPNDMNKSFNIALKAFKADEFEKKANEKESETINRYLSSKKGVKVEGSAGTASTQSVDTRKFSWDQLGKHALERVKAANTPQ